MCGIAGALSLDGGAVDRDELIATRDRMAARGPDGIGAWFAESGRVGLVHRRLAIQDLSDAGAQPMHDAEAGLVLVFNGEIYNQLELRAELEAAGHRFRSRSDTEVVLALYRMAGMAMLGRLRGMFALALWDGPRGELLLARDAFGIKPLYYAASPDAFRFASQVKALPTAAVDTSPCAAGHVGFLLWGSVPDPHTLYRGVRALPAGHAMVVRATGAEAPRPFADIAGDLLRTEPASLSREAALLELSEALRESVEAHLLADVPVGVFLSAGLDSTLIASIAVGKVATTRSVTLGFGEYAGTELDEVPLAEAVAASLATDHRTIGVGAADFAAEHDRLLDAMDQPSIDGVNSWFVARAAREAGLKVALSGLGGDELFASYPSFRQIPQLVRAVRGAALVPGFGRAVRVVTAPVARRFTSPKYAGLLEYGGTYGGAYLVRRALFMPWELPDLIDPDMAREGWRALQPSIAIEPGPAAPSRLIVSALEAGLYMRNQLLRDADWAGMAHSLEIRVPLVDTTLWRRAAPILAAWPGLTKADVVGAATSLPRSILDRPKSGFAVPVREWLLGRTPTTGERGLRRWARHVYARLAGGAA
jgi:asparagine synthase (glutamine-hydrolysing)